MNQNIVLYILVLFIVSCSQKKTSETSLAKKSAEILIDIPDKTVNKSVLDYDRKKSLWTLNGQLYSGYVVSFYPDNTTLKEKFGIFNGKKQNEAIQYYADGHYKHVSSYNNGKLHGHKKTWSPDSLHILLSHLNYVSGKAHGEQKKWYPTGELFKKLNFNMGKQEGIQQAYRKNGALFANYEAKEGRVFGLKKATLCFGIQDDKVKYREK